ncbi:unnamed protein product [Pylaiella littoralis]
MLPALGVVALAFLSHAPQQVQGHAYLMSPVARNFYATSTFQQAPYPPDINWCPHCFQSRGPGAVRARAENKTDPDLLAEYGDGEWPHLYYPREEYLGNGNYNEPEGISVRHGICGDPEQTKAEGINLYGLENSKYATLQTFVEGGIMEAKIIFSTYHWGHLEFFLCNADEDMDDPDGVVTQTCFNEHPLDRADDDGDPSPIDPNHKGRYYVDPPCLASTGETSQTTVAGAFPGDVVTARYKLPDGLTCERCIVQMIYYTGNSCKHPGYDDFNPPSWPSTCAPEKSDWVQTSVGMCGEETRYPEEFWNCADIYHIDYGRRKNGDPSDLTPTPAPQSAEKPSESPADPTPAPEAVDDGDDDDYDDGAETPAPETVPTPVPMPAVDLTDPPSSPAPTTMVGGTETCDEPVAAYEQCGGSDSYDGSTCCVNGFECVELADCYSQCRPIDPAEVEECSEVWEQCGGNNWEGPTCCVDGTDCVGDTEWYSQCLPETL